MKRYLLSDFQFAPSLRIANTPFSAMVGSAISIAICASVLFGLLNIKIGLLTLILVAFLMAPLISGRSVVFVTLGMSRGFCRRLFGKGRKPTIRRFDAFEVKSVAEPSSRGFDLSNAKRSVVEYYEREGGVAPIVIRLSSKRPAQLSFEDEESRFTHTSLWLDKLVELAEGEISKLRIVHTRDEMTQNSGVQTFLVAGLRVANMEARSRCEYAIIKIMAANPEIANFTSLSCYEAALFCAEQFFEFKGSPNIRYRTDAMVVRNGSYQIWGITDFGRFSGGFGEIFVLFAKIAPLRMVIIEISPLNQQLYAANIRATRSRIDAKALWRNSRGYSNSISVAKASKAISEAETDVANNVRGANFAFFLVVNKANGRGITTQAKRECAVRLHGFVGVVEETWNHVNPMVVS
ncbi:MAG: hypothetical protein M0019_04065 [Actinomycetota bacterium]|nr:hypothetical protein [Actinomycetota bacterium]